MKLEEKTWRGGRRDPGDYKERSLRASTMAYLEQSG